MIFLILYIIGAIITFLIGPFLEYYSSNIFYKNCRFYNPSNFLDGLFTKLIFWPLYLIVFCIMVIVDSGTIITDKSYSLLVRYANLPNRLFGKEKK